MTKFIVDSSYWNLFPTSKIGVILIKDYHMDRNLETELKQLLSDSYSLAKNICKRKNSVKTELSKLIAKHIKPLKLKKVHVQVSKHY